MKQKYLFVSLLLLSLILILTLIRVTATKSSTMLADNILTEKALEEARLNGLVGTSKNQVTTRMNLSDWNKLINAELGMNANKFGLTSDTPVFVLAIRGDVEWRGVGLPQPGQEIAERYDNITVVLNARTGDLLWVGAYYPNYPMPVQVP